jgi:allophanate hydrolase subunit 2
MVGLATDGALTTITIGTSQYYRISVGLIVQQFTGDPIIEMLQNNVPTGVFFPIKEIGETSLDWIASYTAGGDVRFRMASSQGEIVLASPGGCNAYFTINGYR